jgi:hypothetical protein
MYFGTVPSVITLQYVKGIHGIWGGIRGEESSTELHIIEVETMHEQALVQILGIVKTSGDLALKHLVCRFSLRLTAAARTSTG